MTSQKSPPLAYNLEPSFADSIINLLADLYLNAKIIPKKKPKKKLHPVLIPVLKSALPEIQKIYSAIKKQIGFSAYVIGAKEKHRQAALNCFDNSNENFEAIKREYLEDPELYKRSGGQEIRDFEGKLLQKIMGDLFPELGRLGRGLLRKGAKK